MKASKLQLAHIMQSAWAISKQAAVKFGGTVKQYLSESLKIAWRNFKSPVKQVKIWCAENPTNYSYTEFGGKEQYGAWIDTKGLTPEQMPRNGEKVAVMTKRGELHIRAIGAHARAYKTGRIMQLVDDADVAKKAKERYYNAQLTSTSNNYKPNADKLVFKDGVGGWCNKCKSYCWGDCTAA